MESRRSTQKEQLLTQWSALKGVLKAGPAKMPSLLGFVRSERVGTYCFNYVAHSLRIINTLTGTFFVPRLTAVFSVVSLDGCRNAARFCFSGRPNDDARCAQQTQWRGRW